MIQSCLIRRETLRVAELIAKTACADLLPLELVGLTLTEVVEDNVTVIAP